MKIEKKKKSVGGQVATELINERPKITNIEWIDWKFIEWSNMGVLIVLLSFVALFAAIMCYIKNIPKMRLNIPSPMVLPIIGHAHMMIGLNNEGE